MIQFHDALIDPASLKINPTTKENSLQTGTNNKTTPIRCSEI